MITIKELAAYTGLSASTVSVVLRGEADTRKISQKTRDIVWKAAKELNYQPNISARRLREPNNNTLTVAFFWTADYRAHQMVRFLQGMQQAAQKSERNIEIIIHPYKNDELYKERSLIDMNMFNAAIISNISKADMDYLENNTFYMPIVINNRYTDKFCTVNIDEPRLGGIAAEVFASLGYKRAAILTSQTSPTLYRRMEVRVDGFCEACKSLGLSVTERVLVEHTMDGGYEGGIRISRMADMPDCLFCTSDNLCYGALRAFYKTGVRIPDDLKIITVSNHDPDFSEYAYVSLSSVYFPMEAMAGACMDLLLEVVEGKIVPPHSVQIPIKYIARESCGPAKFDI